MSERRFKKRVLVAAGLVALATTSWWAWSDAIAKRVAQGQPQKEDPFVRLTGGAGGGQNSLLNERADFFDPTPLFLPTSRNFGQGGLPRAVVRQPGQVFENFTPKLNYAESGLAPYAADPGVAPESVPDLLSRSSEAPFAGFGETSAQLGKVEARSAILQVKSLDGNVLKSETLDRVALPNAEFAPMEFVVAVSPGGLVGMPVLVTSSGWEEVDAFFRDYLRNIYRLGERVGPGRYRVLVGS